MQNVNNTAPNSPANVATDRNNPSKAQPETDSQVDPNNPNANGRGLGSRLAGVGRQATDFGRTVASKGGDVLLGTAASAAQEKAKDVIRLTITDRIRDFCSIVKALPYGHTLLKNLVHKLLFPYYKQANPHTQLTADLVSEKLILGHTEFLEDDFVETFDKLIQSSLSEEDRERYKQGDKKVILKAFQNMFMNQVRTVKEPGGLKKITTGIANFIPFVNRLPEGAKPWVGGTIGTYVAYKVLHGFWKLLKLAVIGFTGIKGFQFFKNKVSRGRQSEAEAMAEEKPKRGLGGKLVDGLGKVAQAAAGPGAGMMGGAPGGGLGGVLGALAGGGR